MFPIRKCGKQGFECGAQGLGCMGMSGFYAGFETEEAQAESIRVLQKAAEYKGIMLDSADSFGPYTNEQMIGKAIAGKRDMYTIATKCGTRYSTDIAHAVSEASTEGVQQAAVFDCSPEFVKKACQDSLDRLGIDCIDLFYISRYDMKTPIEDTMQAMNELIAEGKIKYVGVSEFGPVTLRKAHAVCPISAYQTEYSLFDRGAEEEIIPTCRELGIGIVAYGPLGSGFLTGAIKSKDDLPDGDLRRMFPRYQEYLDDNLKLVEVVKEIANAKGCTAAQVALAWVHAQGDDIFPIPGTKKVSRLEENLDALKVQLSEDDRSKLGEIADKIKGDRVVEDLKVLTHQGQKDLGF